MRLFYRICMLLLPFLLIFYIFKTQRPQIFYLKTYFTDENRLKEIKLFQELRKNLIDKNDPFLNFTLVEDKDLKVHAKRIVDYCCGKQGGLLIFIISRPKNFYLRDSFREVFKNRKDDHVNNIHNKSYGICYLYIIGYSGNKEDDLNVDLESLKYSDVIRIPLLESYYNLPKKVMVSLAILNNFSQRFHYVCKCDDDIVIRGKYLLPDLYKNFKGFEFIGFIKHEAEVIRDPLHKFYLSKKQYPSDVFPDYPQGNGYIIRADAIVKIISQYNNSTYIKFEDVLMGSILRDRNMRVANYIECKKCQYKDQKCQSSYVIEVNNDLKSRPSYLRKYEHDFN